MELVQGMFRGWNRGSGDPALQLQSMSQTLTAPPSSVPGRNQYEPVSSLNDAEQSRGAGVLLEREPQPAEAKRKYFLASDIDLSQLSQALTVLVIGRPESRARPQVDLPAQIPCNTSSFKMVANFNNLHVGYYNVKWRIKMLQNCNIPNGLCFVVNVSYNTEPDVSGTLDVILPAEKLRPLTSNQWYDLVLDEKLVIKPHLGRVRIQAALCNNENIGRHGHFGLVVEHVEVRPMALALETPSDVIRVIVPRAATPRFTIDSAKPHTIGQGSSSLLSPPVTRLASSKGGQFIASLALSQDAAYITVWDIRIEGNITNLERDLAKSYKRCATAVVSHFGIGRLPIGLALSTNGDQVAIYQEPRIGDWADGSKVEKALFPFRLYNNPLVAHNVVLDLGSVSPNDQPSGISEDKSKLAIVPWEHDLLKTFVGFGSFPPKSPTNDPSGDGPEEPLFVACSGVYLDVFKTSPYKRWKRMHTIALTDLLPTLSRRITCKMMMDSITNNTFMWLEDNGRGCTIWNLLTGENITHISSVEGSKFKGPNFRNHNRMAISPHQTAVALASVDGTLTTYFTNTGIAISNRKFPGYKIEYVGFHGQDEVLLVILRSSATYELSSRILDSFQLKHEVDSAPVPIPAIGSTNLAVFDSRGLWGTGIVCEPDGSNINFYISYHPTRYKVDKASANVVKADPEDVVCPSTLDENIQYRLRTGIHSEPLPEGDGVSYWVLRVEVVEENRVTGAESVIASFIPEPWMRAMTSDSVHPEKLQSTFFAPCRTRFAIVGVQTMQIWNLPTMENPKCSLQFIWSQPRGDKSVIAYKSPYVKDYYMDISGTSIYMDMTTGNTMAEIRMKETLKKKAVYLPGPRTLGARHAIIPCFRSIHLLAAAYAFSRYESNKAAWTFTFEDHAEAIIKFAREHINRMVPTHSFSPQGQYSGDDFWAPKPNPTIHEFTNGLKDDSDSDDEDNITHPNTPGREDADNDNEQIGTSSNYGKVIGGQEVVTIPTLLLNSPCLQNTNEIFVEGLLDSVKGDWIPRDNKSLNPIKRAIEMRNGHLVEIFIDYCIRNARKYHPTYMMPVVQCLNELSDRFPNILADMFKKASYIPVQNPLYVASHAVVANPQFGGWIMSLLKFRKFEKSNNINDYSKPVFSLRSQLPFRATSLLEALHLESSVRSEDFPVKQEIEEEKKRLQSRYAHKIYVAPFPKLSVHGPTRSWFWSDSTRSTFIQISGQDCFGSPAMVSTLKFKWYKFGFLFWLLRFLVVLAFFILILLVTTKQIQESTLDENRSATADNPSQYLPPTDQEIASRYLVGYRPLFKAAIGLGIVLFGHEIMQLIDSPQKYLMSPYNYLDLAACITPAVGCFLFLNTVPGTIDEDTRKDAGPQQIWMMSFAILFLYLNILFELRILRPLGIVVNIILNITRRITWFFLIFGLFLVGFTHALLHLLHTRRYKPCMNGNPCEKDYPDGYPMTFPEALFTSYFFLAGRFDPIQTSLESGTTSFHIMMGIFYFFTTILLLNILIALMNDAFNESKEEGQVAWLKQWSEVIADVESFMMTNSMRQFRDYFPDYIYYGASEQEAELYESEYNISNKSNLSIENRFLADTFSKELNATQQTQRVVLKDVVQILSQELEQLKQILKSKQDIPLPPIEDSVGVTPMPSSEDRPPLSPVEITSPAIGAFAFNDDSVLSSPVSSVGPYPLSATPTRAPTSTSLQNRVIERLLSASSMRHNAGTVAIHSDFPATASPTFVNMPQNPTVAPPVGLGGALPGDRPPTTVAAGSTEVPSASSSLPNEPQACKITSTSSHSLLQQQLHPLRLADDALYVYRRLQENNDVNHPMYAKPTRGREADDKPLDTNDDDSGVRND